MNKFNDFINVYKELWDDLNLFGKITFYPLMVLVFPVVAFVILISKDQLMSGYQTKKIDINEYNVKLFTEMNGGSLQPFVNAMLEKYFLGKLVELNDENFNKIKSISGQMKTTFSQAVNDALEPFEFDVKETPKIHITLDQKKKTIKHKIAKRNPITDFE